MYCINCNKEVDKEAKKCPYCGTDFEEKAKPIKKCKDNHKCECNNCNCNNKDDVNGTLVGVLIVGLLLVLGIAAICTIILGGAYLFKKEKKNQEPEIVDKSKVSWNGIDLKIPEGYKYKDKGDVIEIYNQDMIYDLKLDGISYDDAKEKKDQLLKTVLINSDEEITITSAEIETYDYREYIVAKGENDTYRYVYFITTSSETDGTVSVAAVYKIGASNDKKVISEVTKLIKGIKRSKNAVENKDEERALSSLLRNGDGVDRSSEEIDRDLFKALDF
jgi:hypothetical protein